MECDDSVHNSFVKVVDEKVVSDKVKSVVPFVSKTVKTDNSLKSDKVDTLKVVRNDSDTTETIN